MGVAVGIDLGTTNTVVGVVRDGRAVTLADEGGRRLIPSIVSFHPTGKVLVGEQAKERRIIDPSNTIYSVKRLIGRTWDMEEVQRARRALPFELVEGPKQGVAVVARGETYMLPEISAFVLRRAKAVAEAALGQPVDRAVITVPANFNDLQRAATKLAGKLAGLEVLRILNEPTAAALAYGQATGQSERIAVYDLGGGTFDITLLDLSGNVFEVLATGGDTALGGDDIDQLIADLMAQYFLKTHHADPRADPSARATLRARAEVLKVSLSAREEATIELNDVVRGEGGVHIQTTFLLKRGDLERIAQPLIDRTLETCRFSIETIGLKLSEIERIILVGGSTRMPLVVRKVEEYFKKPATGRVNPDEVVALGAAIQAAALSRVARDKSLVTQAPTQTGRPPTSPPFAPVGSQAPAPITARPPTPSPFAPIPSPAASRPPTFSARPPEAPLISTIPPVDESRRPTPRGVAMFPSSPPPEMEGEITIDPVSIPPPGPPDLEGPPGFDAELVLPKGSRPQQVTKKPPPLPPQAQSRLPAGEPRYASSSAPPQVPSVAPARPSGRALAEGAESGRYSSQRAIPVSVPPVSGRSDMSISRRPAPLLIDVTPISLGVETAGGFCDFLISANTPVPCDRTRVFLTASDGQTTVVVKVAQGESERFADNTYLGDLHLTGLVPAARGEVQVAVTFEIDVDGILNVRAKDEGSGRETLARLYMVGTQSDAADVQEMMARQTRQELG
jgi:molecular chaperone DnaK